MQHTGELSLYHDLYRDILSTYFHDVWANGLSSKMSSSNFVVVPMFVTDSG